MQAIVHFRDAFWIAKYHFHADWSLGKILRLLIDFRITLFKDSMAFVV